MFENIQLITKRDNIIRPPDHSWTKKSRILCTCELSLGLGEKFTFTPVNPIPLNKLIHFYVFLTGTVRNISNESYHYSFNYYASSITIAWAGIAFNNLLVKVGYSDDHYGRVVFQKQISRGAVWSYRYDFFMAVMGILTKHTQNEVCTRVGEQFFAHDQSETYEFKMGQKVRTILGPNVKTPRRGFIIYRFKHRKLQTNMYQLLVDGKIAAKYYLPGDLEIEK